MSNEKKSYTHSNSFIKKKSDNISGISANPNDKKSNPANFTRSITPNNLTANSTYTSSNKPSYDQLILQNISKAKNQTVEFVANPSNVQNDISNQLNIIKNLIKNKPNIPASKSIQKVKVFIGKDFRVFIKPSCKQVAMVLAKFNDATYNIKGNEWSFDIENYKFVEKELTDLKVQFDKIPPGTLLLANKTIRNDSYSFEGGIFDNLMGFQRDSVNFAINRNGRILLADDMGLGKTIQALAIANYYQIEWPLLIITPASLCYSWSESISQFLGEDASIIREKSDFGNRISVMSYNIAVNLIDTISLLKFGVIICDECHYLKSSTSKRTKVLLPVLQKTSRLLMLSGTPATSRPLELYPILCALDKTIFPTFAAYGARYCDARKKGMFMDYKGCSNAIELSTVIEKAFMIRRLKDDVLKELPKKFRRQIFLETKGNKMNNLSIDLKDDFFKDNLDVSLMTEYKNAALIKKEPVLKYLESVVEKNVKCLVFAHHKEMIDGLEEFCLEKKLKYIKIDGSTLQGKRQALVDQFQNGDDVRIAILSLTAASTGLTLTSGKAVIFAELYWNPGVMLQAEDRIHRIGQADNVDIHYLVAKNTIDEVVWPKLLRKLNVLESLGMSKNDLKLVKGVNAEDPIQQRLDFKRER